jgi:8-oxo-dGTP pyrophosphatase MutT (NUDIX family)
LFQTVNPLLQVAALPYIHIGTDVEILLITSRRQQHWIIPRGWPVEGESFAYNATREANEEAGAIGNIGPDTVGHYVYKKRTGNRHPAPCRVLVYPLQITQQRLDWHEKAERKLTWCPLHQAASTVHDKGLGRFLYSIARASTQLPSLEMVTPLQDWDPD